MRCFLWPESSPGTGRQDKESKKAVALNLLIYVTTFALCLQLTQRWNRASQGSISERAEDTGHLPHWAMCLALSMCHPRAACAHGVESTARVTHFRESVVQNSSKTGRAFMVPPLVLSPPYFFDKRVDLEKAHLC